MAKTVRIKCISELDTMEIGYHQALLAAAIPKKVIKNQLPGRRDYFQEEEKKVQLKKKSEKEVRDDILKQSLKPLIKSRKVESLEWNEFFTKNLIFCPKNRLFSRNFGVYYNRAVGK